LTLSRKIDVTTATHLADRKIETIFNAYMQVYSLYRRRGFRVTTVHADGEFKPMKAMIEAKPGSPEVNLTSRGEHVPEIERRIRVVKERARAVQHSLPFKRLPKLMTTHLVLHVVRQLTYFPSKAGISETLSPRMLIKGESVNPLITRSTLLYSLENIVKSMNRRRLATARRPGPKQPFAWVPLATSKVAIVL